VGPSLGADSIVLGKKAFLVSFALIACFMVAFYGIYGCFATVALLANIIFIVAILASLQASLTMPGIAGMILTMGMAVDANVLIFERIREELHKNISLPKAIALGFEHAFKTILDSNITTILVAIILYYFGMGAVKGFALTLMIGIASSMFSAITLTRLMIYQLLKFNKVRLI
jgi:preprotein translocase subunit SecD